MCSASCWARANKLATCGAKRSYAFGTSSPGSGSQETYNGTAWANQVHFVTQADATAMSPVEPQCSLAEAQTAGEGGSLKRRAKVENLKQLEATLAAIQGSRVVRILWEASPAQGKFVKIATSVFNCGLGWCGSR